LLLSASVPFIFDNAVADKATKTNNEYAVN
jgi:hypothetical protein